MNDKIKAKIYDPFLSVYFSNSVYMFIYDLIYFCDFLVSMNEFWLLLSESLLLSSPSKRSFYYSSSGGS